jgi:hypothetical protein
MNWRFSVLIIFLAFAFLNATSSVAVDGGGIGKNPGQWTTFATGGKCHINVHHIKGQESRVSDNFDNGPFNRVRKVKFTFLGISHQEDYKRVKITVMADKDMAIDRSRSDAVGDGDTANIASRTDDDKDNYMGRLDFPGGADEFFKRNPNFIVEMELLD